jgi:tetratricopeptide (TPR) repeat protein
VNAIRSATARALLLSGIGLICAAGAAAQLPAVKTEAPPAPVMVCSPDAVPTPPAPDSDLNQDSAGTTTGGTGAPSGDSMEAGSVADLTSDATQALILGDLDTAAALLDRALAADPRAAEAAYLRGRVAAQRETAVRAAEWFCRYLALAPRGPSAGEAERHLARAADEGAARALYVLYSDAVALYEQGSHDAAEQRLSTLLDARPNAAEAWYNRAVVRAATGRPGPARGDLARYLELRPGADDRVIVEDFMGSLAAASGAGPRPATAFMLGAVLPGAGQYYTSRTGLGVLVTGIAAVAVGTGIAYRRTTVSCRDASATECPPDLVIDRETERPYLVPALAAAGGVALIAAIEAALHARSQQRTRFSVPAGSRARLELIPGTPRVARGGTAVGVALVRLRF